MDAETDLSTTEMLRAACADCTLLTIAHRLHTIIDYHQIAVMDAGCMRELAPPAVLLRDKASLFAQLVADTGAETAAQLAEAAEAALEAGERHNPGRVNGGRREVAEEDEIVY